MNELQALLHDLSATDDADDAHRTAVSACRLALASLSRHLGHELTLDERTVRAEDLGLTAAGTQVLAAGTAPPFPLHLTVRISADLATPTPSVVAVILLTAGGLGGKEVLGCPQNRSYIWHELDLAEGTWRVGGWKADEYGEYERPEEAVVAASPSEEAEHDYYLSFFLEPPFDEDTVMRVLLLVQHMGKSGRWPRGRPDFVDQTDEASATRPEDEPIRTVGGLVPLRAPGAGSSKAGEARELERVTQVINRLCEFTSAVDASFEVQLGGKYVGRVAKGEPDTLLSKGLLDEWERSVGA